MRPFVKAVSMMTNKASPSFFSHLLQTKTLTVLQNVTSAFLLEEFHPLVHCLYELGDEDPLSQEDKEIFWSTFVYDIYKTT